MRGKAVFGALMLIGIRITPAYAGKSYLIEKMPQKKKDHPRLCGEKHRQSEKCYSSGGSPPPMRGKGLLLLPFLDSLRITPAYAGKSLSTQPYLLTIEDHPRLCGEKIVRFFTSEYCLGSPPPMRGKD